MTIGADGLPIISYHDSSDGELRVAHCSDASCSSATVNIVDDEGFAGQWTSVTLGADGLPLVAYYAGFPSFDLRVAHCSDASCSAATINTVDSTDNVGDGASVTIGADGLPLISYFDGTDDDLKVAHCSDALCSSATVRLVDGTGNFGLSTSVTIGADGFPFISYFDQANHDLKVVQCLDVFCLFTIFNTVDSADDVGDGNSVTIGADGLPIISYLKTTFPSQAGDLKVAHCSNASCSAATITTVDSLDDLGQTSVTIGADGLPFISYGGDLDLKVAHCSNALCSSATITTVDIQAAGPVGRQNSVTIGIDGLPFIAYYAAVDNDLKAAHCANPFCAPFFRRR